MLLSNRINYFSLISKTLTVLFGLNNPSANTDAESYAFHSSLNGWTLSALALALHQAPPTIQADPAGLSVE